MPDFQKLLLESKKKNTKQLLLEFSVLDKNVSKLNVDGVKYRTTNYGRRVKSIESIICLKASDFTTPR